jgi:lipopolysaccharide/colanic/teichoic acid biosynthesis glycosyltransferase
VKRLFDLLAVALSSPLWVPLMALTALATAFSMGRPVFFLQERAGKGGRPFRIFKFRTMKAGDAPDAERMTAFGNFLRRTSLDELPELINVIRGEMSLVGPRPLPVRYLPRYSSLQSHRHDVLPGITGWAQVNGRNSLTWAEKFSYDIEYVSRRSLKFDILILALTVAKVLFPGRGISHEGEATMSEFIGCEDIVR